MPWHIIKTINDITQTTLTTLTLLQLSNSISLLPCTYYLKEQLKGRKKSNICWENQIPNVFIFGWMNPAGGGGGSLNLSNTSWRKICISHENMHLLQHSMKDGGIHNHLSCFLCKRFLMKLLQYPLGAPWVSRWWRQAEVTLPHPQRTPKGIVTIT